MNANAALHRGRSKGWSWSSGTLGGSGARCRALRALLSLPSGGVQCFQRAKLCRELARRKSWQRRHPAARAADLVSRSAGTARTTPKCESGGQQIRKPVCLTPDALKYAASGDYQDRCTRGTDCGGTVLHGGNAAVDSVTRQAVGPNCWRAVARIQRWGRVGHERARAGLQRH